MALDTEKWGWVLFTATYLVGDVATTAAGLRQPNVAEANPVLGPLVEGAPYAFVMFYIVLVKLGATLVLCSFVAMLPEKYQQYPPYILAFLGLVTTGNNLYVIARA